jgi:hypothetical protein
MKQMWNQLKQWKAIAWCIVWGPDNFPNIPIASQADHTGQKDNRSEEEQNRRSSLPRLFH